MKVNKNTKETLVKIIKDAVYKVINNVDLTPHDREQINRQISEADFMSVLTDDIVDAYISEALTKAQGVEISLKETKKKERKSHDSDPGGWETERLMYELEQARNRDERYSYQGSW